jgi:type II secretory pathway component HofQ
MEEVNKNPTDFMFNMRDYNQATRSEISKKLGQFISDVVMKLPYDNSRRIFIVGENSYGKRAYHPLSQDKLETLIRMMKNVEFFDDGFFNTFRERDSQYWEAYNLVNTFMPEFVYFNKI